MHCMCINYSTVRYINLIIITQFYVELRRSRIDPVYPVEIKDLGPVYKTLTKPYI